MKDKKSSQDFGDFLDPNNSSTPEEVNARVLNYVKSDLDPSHRKVFSKLVCIQSFVGFLTLTFCPQFDLSLTSNDKLFHYLHHTFGANICMAICGSIFIGSGAIFASYVLSLNEIRKIKESKLLYYTSLSSLALASFGLIGADVYVKMSVFWFLGASLIGALFFECNRLLRFKIATL